MKTQEIVSSIEDFYDCPREGIAEYQGKVVYYKCIFDEEGLRIAQEAWLAAGLDWSIWKSLLKTGS